MGKIVKKIVLTGGPSAGKSSSLNVLKKYFVSKGYLVYIVNESVTELKNNGIIPGKNELSLNDFQRIVLNYQLYKESLIETVARNSAIDKEIIIFYDRGVLDNKAYITDAEFRVLINELGVSESELLNRYDLIIHLETGAKSNYYRLDNNSARSETKEEARILDSKTFDAWKLHNNLKRIKCYKSFSKKQKKIIRLCENSLNKNTRKQFKYNISDKLFPLSILNDESTYNIEQYYLNFNDGYEHRIRKTSNFYETFYTYIVQKKNDRGVSNVLWYSLIDESVFQSLLNNNEVLKNIVKRRSYITLDDVLFHIDLFDDGNILLESNDSNFDYKKLGVVNEVFLDNKEIELRKVKELV